MKLHVFICYDALRGNHLDETEQLLELFESGNVEAARAFVRNSAQLIQPAGYGAHPVLRAFVERHSGHCYKPQHLQIADLLLSEDVKAFRDAVVRDQVRDVQRQLTANGKLVQAEFTAGRGIARAIHHWTSTEVAELLLDAGADLHVKTTVHDGETPLAMQLRFGTIAGVEFLLERGADPNQGVTTNIPTDRLEQSIQLLQANGWKINGSDATSRRSTMLHHDANHGFGSRIQIWLTHGADPNVKDAAGQTPLHILAARGTGRDAILALLNAGAEINAKDDAGNTPLDLARRAERDTAATTIESFTP